MPLALSDAELDIVMAAAKPLQPHHRDAFLVDVANALASCNGNDVGPGTVYRICRDIQRRHCDYPTFPNSGAPVRRGSLRDEW